MPRFKVEALYTPAHPTEPTDLLADVLTRMPEGATVLLHRASRVRGTDIVAVRLTFTADDETANDALDALYGPGLPPGDVVVTES